MNVSLNPTLEKYIHDKVSSGLYNSSSEVIREALRLLQTEDQKKKALLSALSEGLDDMKAGRVIQKSARQIFDETLERRKQK